MDGHCMVHTLPCDQYTMKFQTPPARPNRNSWATPNINGIVSVVIRIFPRRGGVAQVLAAPGTAVNLGALLAEARAAAAGGDAATASTE